MFQFFQRIFLSAFAIAGMTMIMLSSVAVPVQAQSLSDFNILGIESIFPDNDGRSTINCSASSNSLYCQVRGFLLGLAPAVAVLVVMWGGYKYFQDGFDDKATGMKYIQGAAIGLTFIYLADFIVNLFADIFTGDASNPINSKPVVELLEDIVNFLLPIAIAIAVLVIVWGGYKYFFGAFSEKSDGKDTIFKGIIGLVVISIARPVIDVFEAILPSTNSKTASLSLDSAPVTDVIVQLINNFLVPVGVAISVFFIVVGAFYLITSNGDENRSKQGRQAIISAIIGLVVILLAVVIAQVIVFATNAAEDQFTPGAQTEVAVVSRL